MNAMRRPSPSGRNTHCATSMCRASRSPRAHSSSAGIAERRAVEAALLRADVGERVRQRDVAEVRANRVRDIRAERERSPARVCDRRSDTTSTTRPNAAERRAPVGETSPLDATIDDGATNTGRPSAGSVNAVVPAKLLSNVPG